MAKAKDSRTSLGGRLHIAKVILIGLKPLLFDQYLGSNDIKSTAIEKVYWDREGFACIPALNLFSALTAENTKSVCKQFYGTRAKKIGMAINSYLNIKQHTLTLERSGEKIHRDNFDSAFEIIKHVARLDKGIPNPKERPMLATPWSTSCDIEFYEYGDCAW
ncbi:MAG: hypothetical protein E6Q97_08700, partial [Desulfurellales bacterium]